MAVIRSVQGDRDGVRWGTLQLSCGTRRHYHFDRFTGRATLSLFPRGDVNLGLKQDSHEGRQAEAEAALVAHIGVVQS